MLIEKRASLLLVPRIEIWESWSGDNGKVSSFADGIVMMMTMVINFDFRHPVMVNVMLMVVDAVLVKEIMLVR